MACQPSAKTCWGWTLKIQRKQWLNWKQDDCCCQLHMKCLVLTLPIWRFCPVQKDHLKKRSFSDERNHKTRRQTVYETVATLWEQLFTFIIVVLVQNVKGFSSGTLIREWLIIILKYYNVWKVLLSYSTSNQIMLFYLLPRNLADNLHFKWEMLVLLTSSSEIHLPPTFKHSYCNLIKCYKI